ncbi:MAG: hypothetical protein ACE5EN_06010 [Nitrospinota bacterium]
MNAPDAGKPPSTRPAVYHAAADVRYDDLGVASHYHMGNSSTAVYKQAYLAAEFAGELRNV